VPQNQRLLHHAGQLLPVALRHVQVGVANTAGLHADQDFVRRRLRAFYFFERQALFEIVEDSGLHLQVSSRQI